MDNTKSPLVIKNPSRDDDTVIDDVNELVNYLEEYRDGPAFMSRSLDRCMRKGEIGKWLERNGEKEIASFVNRFQGTNLFLYSFALSLAVGNKLPKRDFSSVIGYEPVRKTLLEMGSHPDKYGEVSRKYNKRSGGAILLYGPPGCGKTNLANSYAGETSKVFLKTSGSDFLKASSMKSMIDSLKKVSNTVLFIDEIELLAVDRDSEGIHSRAMTIEILANIDSSLKDFGVLIIGATNAPWILDTSVLRSGRFDELVYVGLPSFDERIRLFEFYTRGIPVAEIDFAGLAGKTDFYSCSDIETICSLAADIPWREAIKGEVERPVSQADFENALAQTDSTAIPWLENACNVMFSQNMKSRFEPMIKEIERYRKARS